MTWKLSSQSCWTAKTQIIVSGFRQLDAAGRGLQSESEVVTVTANKAKCAFVSFVRDRISSDATMKGKRQRNIVSHPGYCEVLAHSKHVFPTERWRISHSSTNTQFIAENRWKIEVALAPTIQAAALDRSDNVGLTLWQTLFLYSEAHLRF